MEQKWNGIVVMVHMCTFDDSMKMILMREVLCFNQSNLNNKIVSHWGLKNNYSLKKLNQPPFDMNFIRVKYIN
jgi:hypothetical protein